MADIQSKYKTILILIELKLNKENSINNLKSNDNITNPIINLTKDIKKNKDENFKYRIVWLQDIIFSSTN